MNHDDLDLIARGITPVVQDWIRQTVEPLQRQLSLTIAQNEALAARVVAIEARAPVAGRDGRDGVQGPAGERGPQGEKGLDGVAGRDGIDGKDGRDGLNGSDGKDGDPGRDGADGKDGAPGLDGKDGRDGVDGQDGAPGEHGAPGEKGLDGRDGRDGIDGKDGKDGVTWTMADVQESLYDAGRGVLLLKFNDRVTQEIPFRGPRYMGVWKEGHEYVAGDFVTWGGAVWCAKSPTTAKPNLPTEESRSWVLAVKSGRDGKTGPQGPQGVRGEKGEPGGPKW